MEKIVVSIITPIYKGARYISNLLEMLQKNYEAVNKELTCTIEFIIVNDYPQEKIVLDKTKVKNIMIRVLQLPSNKGIHWARVLGIKQSIGDYILLLDQDDIIAGNYILSQLKAIGKADAVVCNGKNGRFQYIYKDINSQKSALTDEMYFLKGCQIVSPGQVLIKKNAIPEEWLRHIMKKNGADDFFLWILMLKNGLAFTMNLEKIYLHQIHLHNTSADLRGMSDSLQEMLYYLSKLEKLTKKEIFLLNLNILKRRKYLR